MHYYYYTLFLYIICARARVVSWKKRIRGLFNLLDGSGGVGKMSIAKGTGIRYGKFSSERYTPTKSSGLAIDI